jgi:hypothetical protein
VRDREGPLHQGQPAVQVAFGVGIVDVEVDTLLLDGRGVVVGEQRDVRADAGAEPGELEGEVEPPARVALPEQDHQQGRGEQAGRDPAARRAHRLAALVVDRPRHTGGEDAVDDRDRDDQHDPEQGRHPVVSVGVVDREACGVDRGCRRRAHGPLPAQRTGGPVTLDPSARAVDAHRMAQPAARPPGADTCRRHRGSCTTRE